MRIGLPFTSLGCAFSYPVLIENRFVWRAIIPKKRGKATDRPYGIVANRRIIRWSFDSLR
jgi:hypothetical protein